MRFEREVARVNETHHRVTHVPLERLGAWRYEEGVALAPYRMVRSRGYGR
jgi:hypothetical protein